MTNGDIPDFGSPMPPIDPTVEALLRATESEEQKELADLGAEIDFLFGSPTRSELPAEEQMFKCEIPAEVLRRLPKESPFAKWGSGEISYLPSEQKEPPSALFSFADEVSVGDQRLTHQLSIVVHFTHAYQGVNQGASYVVTDEVKRSDGRPRSVEHISSLSLEAYQAQLAVEQAFLSPSVAQEAEGLLEYAPELSLTGIKALTQLVQTMSGEEVAA